MENRARIEHVFSPRAGTIEEIVTELSGYEIKQILSLIELGAIYVDKKRAEAGDPIAAGAYLRLHLEPRRFPEAEIDWNSRIVARSANYVVIDKPSGVPIHSTVDNRIDHALHRMSEAVGIPLFITHRLDRPTSGLCVFATSKKAQTQFNRNLLKRRIHKTYLALTQHTVPIGELVHYMEPNPRSPKKLSKEVREGWKRCELNVVKCEAFGRVFCSEIQLVTGRTHQIRCQLAAEGCAILGDVLYGGAETEGFGSEHIALHSHRLSFPDANIERTFETAAAWSSDRLTPPLLQISRPKD